MDADSDEKHEKLLKRTGIWRFLGYVLKIQTQLTRRVAPLCEEMPF